jgi:hypothetical protein
MKKWIFIISVTLNLLLIIPITLHLLNSPTYKLGRLERDLKICNFKGDSILFILPKGLTVREISQRGIAAIDQFENNRFEIVITSDDYKLVNYNIPKDSLNVFGNFYSVDLKKK